MAVTLVFCDGKIAEFPSVVTAEKRDGMVHVLYLNSITQRLDSVQAFHPQDLSLAQVHEYGTLTNVIVIGQSA